MIGKVSEAIASHWSEGIEAWRIDPKGQNLVSGASLLCPRSAARRGMHMSGDRRKAWDIIVLGSRLVLLLSPPETRSRFLLATIYSMPRLHLL